MIKFDTHFLKSVVSNSEWYVLPICVELFLAYAWYIFVLQDVTGSKASLLSKESEPTTSPKTKKRRKVRKKTHQTEEQNEYMDPGLAADLNSIIDDVIKPDDTKEDKKEQLPQSTSVTQLRSQPLGKLFIETDSECQVVNDAIIYELHNPS